jgi:putative transcriptional regulator
MDTALAPGLLLAAPALGDPNFDRTVVLLGQHDDDGAVGWILNGAPLLTGRELLREAGLLAAGADGPSTPSLALPVRVGGPVTPGSVWLLFERAGVPAGAEGRLDVTPIHSVTGAREVIEEIARGAGPRRFRLLLGYAGWGPGQLEREIRGGSWLPASIDADLLLTDEIDALWPTAYQRAAGASPAAFSTTTRGSS